MSGKWKVSDALVAKMKQRREEEILALQESDSAKSKNRYQAWRNFQDDLDDAMKAPLPCVVSLAGCDLEQIEAARTLLRENNFKVLKEANVGVPLTSFLITIETDE